MNEAKFQESKNCLKNTLKILKKILESVEDNNVDISSINDLKILLNKVKNNCE
ncbi:hypothetical protein AAJ76_900038214 [Vairimorpha ceranae]|uniref:Uncharacterized protein n=1 Tax=Vairimorpha ceranae TaxID=40302 RepID=A0A0F9YTW0_9MICR|nr:hypothetical protein AAJ76_900038214 [Vairimorpha ceranae]KKO75922.1 hypothetical protein AAJ76_900038214 [Vairimorpha ceranae]